MRKAFTLRLKDRELELGPRTRVMGVVNVTPDSFSDGGLFLDSEDALAEAQRQLALGVDLLDIGGESTRPGSTTVDPEEEKARILPVIRQLARSTEALISVDTWKAEVADAALAAGAHLVNDITGLAGDPDMARVVARHGAGLSLMHNAVLYREDAPGHFPYFGQGPGEEERRRLASLPVVDAARLYLMSAAARALEAGIERDRLLFDPGFGFGLTARENLLMLASLSRLATLDYPLLVGVSRKRFVRRLSGDEEINQGSFAASLIAVTGGAHIVRVHEMSGLSAYLRVADAVVAAETSV